MRLSTATDRDEASGVAVLHAALDAGVTFFDTADAYCWDTADTGHNERLIARALATWGGDRSRAPLRIATKGGLTRPAGRWVADGRARSLASACEASLRALNVERLDLYQLHAPDPRTPFATSVRALHALQRRGLVQSIGLCNVTVGQIEEARRIWDIASVQVELSIWQDASILSGVLPYCETHGIELIAYRPLGVGRPFRGGVLSSRRRTAHVLVSKAAARAGRAIHRASPARSRAVPLCRFGCAGSGVRAQARF
jgi:aryl-alcohol dehydrogenase-like predicted oxidoreductase